MIKSAPTKRMLEQWQACFLQYRHQLSPNKQTGAELLRYLREKYPLQQIHEPAALSVVAGNVTDNAFFAEKLPASAAPDPVAFMIGEIFVGVDLATGYFLVEGSEQLWDELCAFSGLDERDLENYVCVGLYLDCLKKLGRLQDVLG